MTSTPATPRAPRLLGGLALLVLGGLPRASRAGFSPPAELAPWSIELGASWRSDLVPPFWTAARDRLTVEAGAHWRPTDAVTLWLDLDALRHDRLLELDEQRTGAGDLTLGTRVRLFTGLLEGGAGWWLKLPNADDELELGTDETDIGGLVDLRALAGPLALELAGGAELRGDPARSQTQDPVALLQAGLTTGLGPWEPGLRAELQLPTERQSTRAELALSLARRCPLLLRAEATLGLAQASPDWGARLRLGYAGGCSDSTEQPLEAP